MKKELIKKAFIASTVALVLLLPGSAVFAYNESGHALGCIDINNTRNDLNSTSGPIWNFATENNPPNVPSDPFPANSSNDVDINVILNWTGGDPDPGDMVTYDVYFGPTSQPPQVSWNQSNTSYDPDTLSYGTFYCWRIVAWDNQSASTEGPIWGFTTEILTRVDLIKEFFIVNINETFTVSVYVYPSEDIIGVEFGALYYNASLIHANAVTEGDLFDSYNTSFNAGIIDNVAGSITNVSGFTDPANHTNEFGNFCHINFTAQQNIGISPLVLEDVIVTNMTGDSVNITVVGGIVSLVWSVTLDFNALDGVFTDATFGEAVDAHDGLPPDDYDLPLMDTPPMPPAIKSWFDDGLPAPFHKLKCDFRKYPDVRKVWNLSVQWINYSSVPPSITISWDIDEVENCEYNYIVLRKKVDNIWYLIADMLTENNYTYTPQYYYNIWWTDYFQITAGIDILPPEITDVTVAHSYPKDTDPVYGWENFTCRVTDDAEVDSVQLNLTYPDLHTEHITMNKSGDTYYYNATLTNPGGENTPGYNYHIYATDLFGRMNTSTMQLFKLPMNEDVSADTDDNGKVGFVDIMMVAGQWTATGPNGWIRADVDNSGEVGFVDIMMVAGMWDAEW